MPPRGSVEKGDTRQVNARLNSDVYAVLGFIARSRGVSVGRLAEQVMTATAILGARELAAQRGVLEAEARNRYLAELAVLDSLDQLAMLEPPIELEPAAVAQ